nr:MAG TPA: hypothetical protein [Caudoviricetes sp.]
MLLLSTFKIAQTLAVAAFGAHQADVGQRVTR